MLTKQQNRSQHSLFFSLESTLNHKHPLFILANKIDWEMFEREFSPLYCPDNGRPAKPIHLMVGLLILKRVYDLSDESMVKQRSENNYYQYFCGEQEFQPRVPCEASELVHFRHRIGKKGVELILRESICINGKDSNDTNVYIDTTVQEKNITFPTDDKLARKIVKRCWKMDYRNGLKLRQSYRRILKDLSCDQRFHNHPQNRGKARKADKKVRTIAGRLVRDVESKLGTKVNEQCISKEKEHKLYEFENKVSITRTGTGVIAGALSFRNEFDGHTLDKAIEQVEKLTERKPRNVICDRGYRGGSKVRDTLIHIPKSFSKSVSTYRKNKERKSFRKRAGIDPVIGHLKEDHRLSRNYYKGIIGYEINVMLAAAGFNFKRMMNKWKLSFWLFFEKIFLFLKRQLDPIRGGIILQIKENWAF
ncbi:MAG: transposase [Parabacteroides sp.]|nr:transposase [Eubacteriales bacterium]MDD4589880.1 transposase [Parabacteroides sp.]